MSVRSAGSCCMLAAAALLATPVAAQPSSREDLAVAEQGRIEDEINQRLEGLEAEAAFDTGRCSVIRPAALDIQAQLVEEQIGSDRFLRETMAAWYARVQRLLDICPTDTGLILDQQPVTAARTPSGEAPPPPPPDSGRRGSLFDLGIYAGGAWSEDWFDDSGVGFEGQQQDEFAARAAESIRLLDLRGFVEFGDPRAPVRITFRHADGSVARTVDFPAGQGQYGGVYTAPSPSGTSGVQLQLFGMDAAMRVDVSEYSAAARVPLLTIFSDTPESGKFELRPMYNNWAEIGFERSEREDTGSIDAESGSFFFRQQRRQSLDENRFSLGLAGEWILPFATRLQLRLRGHAGGYYRDAEFDSFEQLSSNVVPAADRDFTIELHDEDDGFGFRGELGGELRFAISPRLSLFVDGSAEYLSAVGGIYNPRSSVELLTEGRTAGFVVTDAMRWRAGGGLVLHFGPDRSR